MNLVKDTHIQIIAPSFNNFPNTTNPFIIIPVLSPPDPVAAGAKECPCPDSEEYRNGEKRMLFPW